MRARRRCLCSPCPRAPAAARPPGRQAPAAPAPRATGARGADRLLRDLLERRRRRRAADRVAAAFGVTNGDGSLSTVAQLGDVNGDGFGDYAVGLPSADVGGSADAGIIYVFLGHAGALPPTPTALNLASASFRINGHAGEMLGYNGGRQRRQQRRPGRHRDRRTHGRRPRPGAAAAPFTSSSARPTRRTSIRPSSRSQAYTKRRHQPGDALAPSAAATTASSRTRTPACRWRRCPTSTATATTTSRSARPTPRSTARAAAAWPCSTASRRACTSRSTTSWSGRYPYFFHVDFPAIDNQHIGASVASVGDMTGDGRPGYRDRRPAGRLQRHRLGLGLDHQRAPPADRRLHPGLSGRRLPLDQAQLALRRPGLSHRRRSGGRSAGHVRWPASATRPATTSATSRSARQARRRNGRTGSGAVFVVPGQSNAVTRNLAVTPPLQTIHGPLGRCRYAGASLAAAGDVDGDGRIDMLRRLARRDLRHQAPPTSCGARPTRSSDLALASSKIAPVSAGAMTGSTLTARLRAQQAPARSSLVVRARRERWRRLVPRSAAAAPRSCRLRPARRRRLRRRPLRRRRPVRRRHRRRLPNPPPTPPAPPATPPAPPATPPAPPATPPAPPATPPAPPATPPAPPATPPAPPATPPGTACDPAAPPATPPAPPTSPPPPPQLPLCPVRKPPPRYRSVKGKRVLIPPAPCRPRPGQTAANARLTTLAKGKLSAKAKAKLKAQAKAKAKAKAKAIAAARAKAKKMAAT